MVSARTSNLKKVKGYVAQLQHRYLLEYEGSKDPMNIPSSILDCPKEIELTQSTPPATAEESKLENISRGCWLFRPECIRKCIESNNSGKIL